MAKHRQNLAALEAILGYQFRDQALLEQALTHKSYVRVAGGCNNERLEFLGDAVVQIVVSQHLYEQFPNLNEGQLAKTRALLVSQPALAKQARLLSLNEYMRVGKGEERTNARERDSLLCDTLEAVFGSIYLDSGLEAVRTVILAHLPDWDKSQISIIDAKSTLQEHLQQKSQATPIYNLAEEHGPDHHKLFVVDVCFDDKVLGRGVGRRKKEAAQAAARKALENIEMP